MTTLHRLLILFKPYLGWILLGILASAITLFSNLALMALSGWFITSMALAGVAGVSMNYFTPAAMIRGAAIFRTGSRYLERLVTHEATFRLLSQLRVWFYRHLEPLAPAGVENYRSGDLFSRIRADIDTLDNFYIRVLVPLSVAILGVTLLPLVVTGFAPLLAAILLLMLLLAGVALPLLTGKLGQEPGKQVVETSARLRTAVIDSVQGLAELTVFGATEQSNRQVKETSQQLIHAQERMSRISGLSQAGMLLCANLALWMIVLNAIPLVESGAIKPPELAMLAMFSLAAFESVMPLPEAFRMLGQTTAAAKRLFAIVDSPHPTSQTGDRSEKPEEFHLIFKSVNFSYPNSSEQTLWDINLDLPPGKRMAVAGPTGSGKSTLIQLLLQFRKPASGMISLADQPLDSYDAEDLREWIAVVPQQVYLFNTSIRENLLVANPNANHQMLEQACRIAQIHNFITSQPDGYDTWVGENGVRLSGGQARRIGIARAMLREFQLLILDEPGEGLDTATYQAVLEALNESLNERSLLMITHQAGGLNSMDEILIIENGSIVERGKPEALKNQNGIGSGKVGISGQHLNPP
jgi:ATP-binding cassette subfamily C protein CydC